MPICVQMERSSLQRAAYSAEMSWFRSRGAGHQIPGNKSLTEPGNNKQHQVTKTLQHRLGGCRRDADLVLVRHDVAVSFVDHDTDGLESLTSSDRL